MGMKLLKKLFTPKELRLVLGLLDEAEHKFNYPAFKIVRDDVEKMLGDPQKRCSEAEKSMKHIGRRSLVAAQDIPSGTILTREMVEVKRPGYGLHPEFIDHLVGAEVVCDVKEDEPLSWSMFIKYNRHSDI